MELDFSNTAPSDLTTEYILSKVSQEEILMHFTGQPVVYNKHILSPLRQERFPSFSFKRQPTGDIIWKDWGTGEQGDCFTLVKIKYGYTHREALLTIYNQLIAHNLSKVDTDVRRELLERSKAKYRVERPIIRIEPQAFNYTDFCYWDRFKISLPTLQNFDVVAAKHVWLTKWDTMNEEYMSEKLIKTYSSNNPTYAYKFKSFDGVAYKIYSPLSDSRFKWLFNGSPDDVEGYDQLPLSGKSLVLTKSLKDIMCLYELGIPAISLQGEHNKFTTELHHKLSKRFDKIIVFYDNDDAGKAAALKIKNQYGLKTYSIPLKYGTKDLSDTIYKHGLEIAKDLVIKRLT
jgi:hypothetical protein